MCTCGKNYNDATEFRCRDCGKEFDKDEMEEWKSFLEQLVWACRRQGWDVLDLDRSVPPFELSHLVEDRQDYWADKKTLQDITSSENCLKLLRSWSSKEPAKIQAFSAALREALCKEHDRPKERLVNLIRRQYNYAKPDLIEICLAVSWYKSKDKKGGKEILHIGREAARDHNSVCEGRCDLALLNVTEPRLRAYNSPGEIGLCEASGNAL